MCIFSKIPFFQRNREKVKKKKKNIHTQNARLYEIRFVEFKPNKKKKEKIYRAEKML